MHPAVSHLEALLTAFGFRFDFADLVEVVTTIGHAASLDLRRGESHCGLNRNSHLETSVAGNGFNGDEAPHFLDDAMHNVEAQSGAFAHALGGEKWFENAGLHFGRNARAVVENFHEHGFMLSGGALQTLARVTHA